MPVDRINLTKGEFERLAEHFNELDQNGDGFLSAEEMMPIIMGIKNEIGKSMCLAVVQETVAHIIKNADTDGDGRISSAEFIDYMFAVET